MGLALRAALPSLWLFAWPAQTVAVENCAHFGANATSRTAGWCYADDRTGVAQCGGCCPGAADCGACIGGKRTSVYPCARACPELGGSGCAVHSGGVDCSSCCCGTAAGANCNASCVLFKRQKGNCIPGCIPTSGPFVCAANESCTVCAACCDGTEAGSDCEACAKKRCPAARPSTAEAPPLPGQPQVAWTLNDRVIVPYRYGHGDRGQQSAFPCGNGTCWLRLFESKKHGFASAIRSSDGQPQWVQPCSFGTSPISLVTGPQGDAGRTALCSRFETRDADVVECLDSVSGETTLSASLNTIRLPPSYFPRSSKIDSAPTGLLVTYSAFGIANTGAGGAEAAEVATIGPSNCTCWQAGLNGGPPFGPGSKSGPGKLPPICWDWTLCGFSCGNEAGNTNCFRAKQIDCKCAIMKDLSSACNMSPCTINGSFQRGAGCLPSCATAAPAGSIVNPRTGQCVPTPPGTNPCVCTMATDGHTITCPQQSPEPPSFVALFEVTHPGGSGSADVMGRVAPLVFNYSLPARTVLTGYDGTVMPGGLLLLALKTGGLTCAENPHCTVPLEPPLQNLSHSLLVLDMVTGEERWRLDLGFSTRSYPSKYVGGTIIYVQKTGDPYDRRGSSVVLNASTGEELWRVDVDLLMARPLAGGHDPPVLMVAEGDDDDFASIRALDVRNGSLLWSWPPVQPPSDVDLAATSWSCDWPTVQEVVAGAKDDGICFIKYGCEGSSCPASLMPLPPISSPPLVAMGEEEEKACGGGSSKEGDCMFAMSARTGHLMFSAKAKVGKKYGGSVWGADDNHQKLLRVGSMLLFADDASVTAVDSNTAAKLWSVPYTPTNLAMLEQPPAPAGRCDAELQQLCAAAKAKGAAACGMCAGTHAGALQSAGCSNDQIDSWCSNSAPSSPQGSGGSSQNRTILLFGVEAQDGKPALIAVDGNVGEVLWNVPLPGPSGSTRDDGWWTVDVLSAGKSTASAGPAGISVVVAGAFTYKEIGEAASDVNVSTTTGGGGSFFTMTSGGSRHRRLQPWPPPPPPPIFLTKYYTWSVNA